MRLLPNDAQALSTNDAITVRLARNTSEIEASQRLRYKIFSEEMGAELSGPNGMDVDDFDAVCEHLIVIDNQRDKVVGTYRILPPWGARNLGRMYSEGEFHLQNLHPISHEIFELGRACIHPDYRNSGVLARLWSGLGEYVVSHRVKYLAGCASVSLDQGSLNLGALKGELLARYLAPEEFRVEPIHGLQYLGNPVGNKPSIPPLLKGYLRLGAWVCGEPAWDPAFDSADFLILLPIERMSPRYAQHFLGGHTSQ